MDSKQFDLLEGVLRQIDSKDFLKNLNGVKEWGGADVIISKVLDNDVKRWLSDGNVVISLQDSEPRRRAVVTQYSKELSWLFYQLRDIFAPNIDYISKYDFYGSLAQSAIDYLEKNKKCENCTDLLKTVVETSRRFA